MRLFLSTDSVGYFLTTLWARAAARAIIDCNIAENTEVLFNFDTSRARYDVGDLTAAQLFLTAQSTVCLGCVLRPTRVRTKRQ